MSATISRFARRPTVRPAPTIVTPRNNHVTTSEPTAIARHLITSALPYINGIKHLGNMVGSMLPADVYSGTSASAATTSSTSARRTSTAPRPSWRPRSRVCRSTSSTHGARRAEGGVRRLRAGLRLLRPQLQPAEPPDITQHFARRLNENGFIEERAIRQVYSPADGRFLPDRYVEGACRWATDRRPGATSARTAPACWTRPT